MSTQNPSNSPSPPVLLVDGAALYAFHQRLKDQSCPVRDSPNYGALLEALTRDCAVGHPFDPGIAFVAISFSNVGQKKFCDFLGGQGFTVVAADYRDAIILPDRSAPYQRFSARLTYVLGMYAGKGAHVVVVTDAFDTSFALHDFVENRGGQVTLAFFRSGMENRWALDGLFKGTSNLAFVDLDKYGKSILGWDLWSGPEAQNQGGLGKLQFG